MTVNVSAIPSQFCAGVCHPMPGDPHMMCWCFYDPHLLERAGLWFWDMAAADMMVLRC